MSKRTAALIVPFGFIINGWHVSGAKVGRIVEKTYFGGRLCLGVDVLMCLRKNKFICEFCGKPTKAKQK